MLTTIYDTFTETIDADYESVLRFLTGCKVVEITFLQSLPYFL